MEFVVGVLALLAGWSVCWIQMARSQNHLESPAESLRETMLGLMSELAQAKEIQMAILTDLEKALERNSELESRMAQENRTAVGLVLEMESVNQLAQEMHSDLVEEKQKVQELRLQLASVLETEIRMDSTPEPVMGLQSQSAFRSGSVLVEQELPELD